MHPNNYLNYGLAGEHLVCADLLLNGYNAFLTSQSSPYDVAVDVNGRIIKIQVKSTTGVKSVPQRSQELPCYLFHTKRKSKNGDRMYTKGEFDIIAFVATDINKIAYFCFDNFSQSHMQLRPPHSPSTHFNTKHSTIDKYPFSKAYSELEMLHMKRV